MNDTKKKILIYISVAYRDNGYISIRVPTKELIELTGKSRMVEVEDLRS